MFIFIFDYLDFVHYNIELLLICLIKLYLKFKGFEFFLENILHYISTTTKFKMEEQFKVALIQSTKDSITLRIQFGIINVKKTATIIANVYRCQLGAHLQNENFSIKDTKKDENKSYIKAGNLIFKYPFSESYTIEDLE